MYRLAETLLAMTRRAGAALLINDRVDVAMALGADGVHLTRKSLPPREARSLVGSRMLIGISCHGLADVREAVDGGVDFVVLGPIYATPSKAPYGPPLAPGILREARRICPLPILAIGGITAARVPEVVGAGRGRCRGHLGGAGGARSRCGDQRASGRGRRGHEGSSDRCD